MNLAKKKFSFLFLFTALLTLFTPTFFPSSRLLFFPSVLITSYYQKNMVQSLWYSILCGCMIDLLASNPKFGLHALSYTLTTCILYSKRKHFFSDNLSTLPMMVYFFSAISTLILKISSKIISTKESITFYWIYSDLFMMPLFDALFGFAVFILPFYLFGKKALKGTDYFLSTSHAKNL